jgi:type II secretory pathway pseudopilin PulG
MTLIELMLVIVIMAIIMTFAVPAFVGIGRGAGLRSAVQGVRSTLSLTRQWAITHREKTSFVYGRDETGSYYEVVNLPESSIQARTYLERSIDFGDENNPPLTFKSDGSLTNESQDGFITVAIGDIRGQGNNIDVLCLTGGIKVR